MRWQKWCFCFFGLSSFLLIGFVVVSGLSYLTIPKRAEHPLSFLVSWLMPKGFFILDHWTKVVDVYEFANFDCDGRLYFIQGDRYKYFDTDQWSQILGQQRVDDVGVCFGEYCGHQIPRFLYFIEQLVIGQPNAKTQPMFWLAETGQCHFIRGM